MADDEMAVKQDDDRVEPAPGDLTIEDCLAGVERLIEVMKSAGCTAAELSECAEKFASIVQDCPIEMNLVMNSRLSAKWKRKFLMEAGYTRKEARKLVRRHRR